MTEIKINTPFIKLDQLLKFAGFAAEGVDAKQMILSGSVRVNGTIEKRRGRKLYPEDVVCLNENEILYELRVK